jgi:glutamine synthetase
LARAINPSDTSDFSDPRGRQTVEIRSPDGSAIFHLLLAGLTTAAEYGLMEEGMIELADKTKVEGNVFENKERLADLEPLPGSCVACSRLLSERRDLYEERGVFPPSVIDYVINLLAKEKDEHLNAELAHMSAEERLHATRRLMHNDMHRH